MKRAIWAALAGLVLALVLHGPFLLLDLKGIGWAGFGAFLTGLVRMLAIIGGMLAAAILVIVLRHRGPACWRAGIAGGVYVVAAVAFLFLGARAGARARHEAFEELARRSEPLVQAIHRFTQEVGEPPESLEDLVPAYLAAVPQTGLADYPEYEYVLPRFVQWELRVDCSRGISNFDVFVYWPTGEYPDFMHGGGVERIGAWAYVHE